MFGLELPPLNLYRLAVIFLPLGTLLSFELFFNLWGKSAMLAGLTLIVPVVLLSLTSSAVFLFLMLKMPEVSFYNPRDAMEAIGPWLLASGVLSLIGVLLWRFWPYTPARLF
jgi:hypothetical protein